MKNHLIYIFIVAITFPLNPLETILCKKQNINRPLNPIGCLDSLQTDALVDNSYRGRVCEINRINFIYKSGGISETIKERWIAGENFKRVGYGYIFSYDLAGVFSSTRIDTIFIQTNQDITYIEFIGIDEGASINIIKSPKEKTMEGGFEAIIINCFSLSDGMFLTKNSFCKHLGIKIKSGLAYIPSECYKNIVYSDDFTGGIIISPAPGICTQIDTIPYLTINDCGLRERDREKQNKKYYDFRKSSVFRGFDKEGNWIKPVYTVVDINGIFLPLFYQNKLLFYIKIDVIDLRIT